MRIKDFTTSFAYLLLFRNLSCSTAKFLMVTTDRNSMALNNFKVTQTIALDLLNMFRQDRDLQVFLPYCLNTSLTTNHPKTYFKENLT